MIKHYRFCSYLLSFFLSLSFISSQDTCGPRIRRNWDTMNEGQRNTYIAAIEIAMERGYHMMFTEIHSESASSGEAHNSKNMTRVVEVNMLEPRYIGCGFLVDHSLDVKNCILKWHSVFPLKALMVSRHDRMSSCDGV